MRNSCAFHGRWLLIGLLNLALFPSQLLAADIFFAEPYTGKKVSGYVVSLPVSRQNKVGLHIPGDCPMVQEHYLSGARRFGNRVQKRLWEKVSNDCTFFQHLDGSKKEAEHDFVSTFDFMNAEILDLPILSNCDQLPSDVDLSESCAPMDVRPFDFKSVLSFLPNPLKRDPDKMQPCQFMNGVFRGYFYVSLIGLRCQPDRSAGGLRILSVNFADIDEDGFLDALLRLTPLGRGVSHKPMVLHLTRFGSEEKFVLVKGVTQH